MSGDPQAQLAGIVRHAMALAGGAPGNDPARVRPEIERLNQIIDAQHPLRHEGEAAPLAEPIPDAIPMTGEEDPIVEVDDAEFAEIVAAFMRSERDARTGGGGSARTRLAQALLPFADTACEAPAVLHAIATPFADFAAGFPDSPDPRPHAADRLLIDTLAGIAARAR